MRLVVTQARRAFVARSPDYPGIVGIGDTRAQAERYFRAAVATLSPSEREKRRSN